MYCGLLLRWPDAYAFHQILMPCNDTLYLSLIHRELQRLQGFSIG
jgi:hypothetical protein